LTRLRRLLASALLGCALAPAASAACGDDLPLKGRHQAEAGGLRVVFAPKPWPVIVGRHFAVDVVLCASPGVPAADALRVDADMPAHRHGMNYRASVKPLGDGRFVAEGLMFHMPGRWRFIFDFGNGAQALRVTHEVEVE
jgi:YtkA-like